MNAAKTPTVAVARVLRGLGLKQGEDFRVTGFYQMRERIGTCVIVFNKAADQLIADNADEIVRLTGEAGFAFRVSVRYHNGRPFVDVKNFGTEVREDAPVDPTAPSVNEDPRVTALADGKPLSAPEAAPQAPKAGDRDAVAREAQVDLLALKDRVFTVIGTDYQTDGWPKLVRRATVLDVLPNFVPYTQDPKPCIGVVADVRTDGALTGYTHVMTLPDFRRMWMDASITR